MDPSHRIKIIQDISNNLSDEEWSVIDLILRQFDLPVTDMFNGEKLDYVITMIEDAGDSVLIALAEHLGLPTEVYNNSSGKSPSDVPFPKKIGNDLIELIELQKALMIAVSTGGPRIQEVNDEYKDRRIKIKVLLDDFKFEDRNPYPDLWNWYGKWSDGSLPTYQSRRIFITDLYQPLLDTLQLRIKSSEVIPQQKPTGWARVDRVVEKITIALETAKDEEDYQSIGLLCREAIISLSQSVYDPDLHQSINGIEPSDTDAKRMLENYISKVLAGKSNEDFRRTSKDVYKLAVSLQHKRTANFRDAALCVEVTRTFINIVSIVEGRRDPD